MTEYEEDPLQQALLLTRGKVVVMLGDKAPESHRRRIEKDLKLTKLIWLGSKDGDPFKKFERTARKADILFLYLGAASHEFTKGMRRVSKEQGSPLIMLPNGYNSRQIAHQITVQVMPPAQ